MALMPISDVPREREVVFQKGPRFYEEGGRLMFAFRVDASTEIGPMEARRVHKEKHWQAYQAFMEAKRAWQTIAGKVDDTPGFTRTVEPPTEPMPPVEAQEEPSVAPEPVKRGRGRPRNPLPEVV
jgi:hypothetical protein